MGVNRWKVFLDTSALIAGIISPTGGASEVLRLCEAGAVELVISRQVIVEADRTFMKKLPELIPDYRKMLGEISLVMVEDPSRKEMEQVRHLIHSNDTPILAAAIKAKVDYLVTWNTKDFLKKSLLQEVSLKIRVPGEFLKEFRGFWLS